MPRLEQVIKGTKREAAKQGTIARPRPTITLKILLKLLRVWESDGVNYDFIMM